MIPSQLTLCGSEFRKASRSGSGGGNCVEYARKYGTVFLRDTKVEFGSAADGIIVLSEHDFDAFQADARAGNIAAARCLAITAREDGMFVFRNRTDDTDAIELVFDQGELDAFLDGVHKGEFDHESAQAAHTADCAHREVQLAAV